MSDQPITDKYTLSEADTERLARMMKKHGGSVTLKDGSKEWITNALAVVSILVTIGAWVWWGGRLSQRMDSIEDWKRQTELRTDAQSVSIGAQAISIAKMDGKIDAIKEWVDKQDQRESRR